LLIEFKSENNRFKLKEDLFKLGIYINGLILKEPEADVNNTSFTLVTSKKPTKFLKQYKAVEIRQGLYCIENISPIPIYVAVASELELKFEKELSIIKEFAGRDKMEDYFRKLIRQFEPEKEELLRIGMTLYSEEITKIIKEEGIMNMAEKNVWYLVKELGFDKKIIEEGKEQWLQQGLQQEYERSLKRQFEQKEEIARKGLAMGMSIESIAELTGLTKVQIKKLKN
jgi:hypothetical protein